LARGQITVARMGFKENIINYLRKLLLGKMYIWEVAAWEIPHLGSCHLGKYPWEVAAWEKAFGKVANINKTCHSFLGYVRRL